MNKKVWLAAIAMVGLFAAIYLGSPFWAVYQFKDAGLTADVDKLDEAVDFPAVRESLKSQLTVAMTTKMQSDPQMRSNPFAGLGMLMMPAIIDKMVDGFVTPDGISALLKHGRVEKAETSAGNSPNVSYGYDYRNLDRFAVTVKGPDVRDDAAPKFVFERRGLFSWKMIRIEIPQEVFSKGN